MQSSHDIKHMRKNIIPAATGFSEPDIILSIQSKKNNAQILHVHFRWLCIMYTRVCTYNDLSYV